MCLYVRASVGTFPQGRLGCRLCLVGWFSGARDNLVSGCVVVHRGGCRACGGGRISAWATTRRLFCVPVGACASADLLVAASACPPAGLLVSLFLFACSAVCFFVCVLACLPACSSYCTVPLTSAVLGIQCLIISGHLLSHWI